MPPLVDLKTPTLSFVDSENKQNIVSDSTVVKLCSEKDAEFGGVTVSTLRSDADTVLDRTQHITSDATSTYIQGTLNVTKDVLISGSVFNITAETKVADSFLVEQSGGP